MSESVEALNQRLEAIKRGIANSLATVVVGRGQLKAARTVKAHVRAAITLAELAQRAAYILHMGNSAAGVILTQLQERRSSPAPKSTPMWTADDVSRMDQMAGAYEP